MKKPVKKEKDHLDEFLKLSETIKSNNRGGGGGFMTGINK